MRKPLFFPFGRGQFVHGLNSILMAYKYDPNDVLGCLLCITGPLYLIDPVSRYKKAEN